MKNEQISAYFRELHLRPVKDRADMNARLEKSAGRRDAAAIRAAIEAGRTHDDAFMSLACTQLRTALETACAADYDFLNRACEYILQYSAGFGEKVLDAGCGNGILTCFIAKSYPASKVIGVDRNADAVRCARQLAQRLDLNNVSFEQRDIAKLDAGPFNTVFCARVLEEDLLPEPVDEEASWYDILAAEAAGQQRVHAFAVALASHIAPDGCLISMEDRERDPLFYAWLTTLNGLETGVIPQTCIQWDCETVFDNAYHQAFIAHRGSCLDHENLYWIWATLLSRGVEMNGATYEGYIGDIFIRRIRGKLLRGMNFYNENGRLVRKMLLWESRREQDADTIYLQQLNLAEKTRSVECYAVKTRDIIDGYYERCKKGWRDLGRRTADFTMDDAFEESEVQDNDGRNA